MAKQEFSIDKYDRLRYHGGWPRTILGAVCLSMRKWKYLGDFIKHRRRIIYDGGAETCGLCLKFGGEGCENCPIRDLIGEPGCQGTPYQLYVIAFEKNNSENAILAAAAEYNFLKAIRSMLQQEA